MFVCAFCSSVALFPLFLCAYCYSVPTVRLILCPQCSSVPSLPTVPLFLATIPQPSVPHSFHVMIFRARCLRDSPPVEKKRNIRGYKLSSKRLNLLFMLSNCLRCATRQFPGIENRTLKNRTQSNPIELSPRIEVTFSWIGL